MIKMKGQQQCIIDQIVKNESRIIDSPLALDHMHQRLQLLLLLGHTQYVLWHRRHNRLCSGHGGVQLLHLHRP